MKASVEPRGVPCRAMTDLRVTRACRRRFEPFRSPGRQIPVRTAKNCPTSLEQPLRGQYGSQGTAIRVLAASCHRIAVGDRGPTGLKSILSVQTEKILPAVLKSILSLLDAGRQWESGRRMNMIERYRPKMTVCENTSRQ